MKRRRARRRSRRSPLPILVLLLATAVVVTAVVLIVRGDTTPRANHASARRHHPSSTRAATAATTAAPASITAPPASIAAPPASIAREARQTAAVDGETAAAAGDTPTARRPRSDAPEADTPPPAAAPPAGAPRLAIIIDDCGQWLDTERGFIALPAALTMSVLPHVRFAAQIAQDAAAAGKGVMLHLPMEPQSGADPGPGRITTAMDDGAIAAQVRDDLAAVPLAAGVNNHEGSRATADDRVMRDVAAVLAQRHVFFVDSRTSKETVAEREATAAGIPTARRDVFLDDVADVDATQAQLRRAAGIAKARGSAIAIGHPRPTTLLAVRALLPELERDGIVLVLARDLVR